MEVITAICLLFFCLPAPGMHGEAAGEGNPVHQTGLQDYVETVYDESNGILTSEANAVIQANSGYIRIGSYGGLSRFNGVEFENISKTRAGAPATGSEDAVNDIMRDSQGRLWERCIIMSSMTA